jgi:hypothetical protein
MVQLGGERDLAVHATPAGERCFEAIRKVGHVPLSMVSLPLAYNRTPGSNRPGRGGNPFHFSSCSGQFCVITSARTQGSSPLLKEFLGAR